ncbi:uncharacterized protein A4U43_C09F750 [Asparagus officinalis]|uniref:Uncharacterized protein n=1 Tax=Asparagus officinalis TaxID=4686 RepID=A0A5P1E496_ASPOF|nr:uncharacterized protein A4U43_C09F750 [Asparagus officinalis]
MKKSEAAIHILQEQDVARYVHEEIKQKPTKMKAKIKEDVTAEKSLGKKRVQKENEAYKKLVMLNEAYEQELIARNVDMMAIKAETEKRFAEQKHIRQKKGEPQIEKEEGQEDEAEKEGDQTQDMGIELKEPKEVKVAEEVPKKKKGRKRREESDTLKAFVQGRRAKSQRTTKKPKFLESLFQTEMPKKKEKGRKMSLWWKMTTRGRRMRRSHLRTIFEVEDHTICRYDMLHLLHGGRLKDETIEALVARLRTWFMLPENAHVERKFAIVTSYFSAILEGREVMNIEALHRESHMLQAGLATQIICEGREWKKLWLKLDSDDPEYLLYFGGSDVPMIEWKY